MHHRTIFLLIMAVAACNTTAQEWIHLSSKNGDIIAPGPAYQQTASLILDVDKDGLNDFILGCREDHPTVLWYRRSEAGWEKYVIEDTILTIEAGGAFHDIDDDGDLDIVFGSDWQGNKVWWWENPYPDYNPAMSWKRREIKNSGRAQHHDMIFGDFDGDGRAELVFWNQGEFKLFIAEIPADPKTAQPWPYTEIFRSSSAPEGLAKADIDGDGKIDIIGGGHWFKHNDGTSYTPYAIDAKQTYTRAAAGQLKSGGYSEVVLVPGDATGPLKWYEWNGSAWIGHDLLGYDVEHGHSLEVADLNGDGNLDIFCAEMRLGGANAKMWIFFGDGNGNFTTFVLATGFDNHESKVGDLDGDGDLDILAKPYTWDTPRVDVWLNNGTALALDHWERHVIDPTKPWRSIFIASADMNGDRLNDILTGGWWYKNPGSPDGVWRRQTIGVPLNNMAAVYDFDSDGDFDVLGTQGEWANPNDNFAWARNDGAGTFDVFTNITKADGDFLQGVAVAHFQSAGLLEVALSWHIGGKGVQMLTVPSNPAIELWPWRKIFTVSQNEALSAGDIDRDGDLDLLLGTQWLRNENSLWNPITLDGTKDNSDRNRLADLNQDGRLDAVVGFEAISQSGKLVWYEQDSLATSTWKEHLIANIVGPMSLDVADMDADGDLDVVAGEHNLTNAAGARLFVFENEDGRGARWTPHVVFTGDEHHDGAQIVDIDNDGDLDIISIGWGHNRVLLYENKAGGGNGNKAPTILTQPQNVTVKANENATFSIAAAGASPLAYQWQKNKTNIPDALSAVYTTPPVGLADGGATFQCVVTNAYGSVTSQAATLTVISASKPRFADGQIVLYTFEEGSGETIKDVSGVGAPLDLLASNPAAINWIPGGLKINSATILTTAAASAKIIDSCRATNEITIEAWIKPANTRQNGPARIVSLSLDPYLRNFTLGQATHICLVRLRTTTTSNNGMPALQTTANSLPAQLVHVVYTRNNTGAAKLYIDGVEKASAIAGGNFSNWASSYRLALANELTKNRPWLGEFHLVAIFNHALSSDQVRQNYEAGPRPGNVLQGTDHSEDFSDAMNARQPARLELHQNYPNPFNPKTTIEFSLAEPGFVELKIFNCTGKEVAVLAKQEFSAGRYKIEWEAKEWTSGVYFCRLSASYSGQTEPLTETRKLLLIK